MRVRLLKQEDLSDRSVCVGKEWTGPGKVPAGTIIEHADAHLLVAMKRAEEVKDASGGTATPGDTAKP